MRNVTIPKPVTIPTAQGPREYSFTNFVEEHVCTDVRWRKDWAAGYASAISKLTGKAAVAELTDEEHERVSACVVETQRIPPTAMSLLMPFIHAITLAVSSEKKK